MTDSTQPDLSNLLHAGAKAAGTAGTTVVPGTAQAETPKTISEMFAEIGGISRLPARSSETEKSADPNPDAFKSLGGKYVGRASTAATPASDGTK